MNSPLDYFCLFVFSFNFLTAHLPFSEADSPGVDVILFLGYPSPAPVCTGAEKREHLDVKQCFPQQRGRAFDVS